MSDFKSWHPDHVPVPDPVSDKDRAIKEWREEVFALYNYGTTMELSKISK